MNFNHIFHRTSGHPNLGHSNLFLQFEVSTRTSFGHEKEVVEQKQMPFLALDALYKKLKGYYLGFGIERRRRNQSTNTVVNCTGVSNRNTLLSCPSFGRDCSSGSVLLAERALCNFDAVVLRFRIRPFIRMVSGSLS